jgi:hypothetical protein
MLLENVHVKVAIIYVLKNVERCLFDYFYKCHASKKNLTESTVSNVTEVCICLSRAVPCMTTQT